MCHTDPSLGLGADRRGSGAGDRKGVPQRARYRGENRVGRLAFFPHRRSFVSVHYPVQRIVRVAVYCSAKGEKEWEDVSVQGDLWPCHSGKGLADGTAVTMDSVKDEILLVREKRKH